ncbi:MAG TPA: putative toxin-antitoxin system toxin component, PIN family [Puia sp.]
MRKDRFVLDNNIWISYFITKKIHLLIEAIDYHELTVFSCDELIEELKIVLNYPRLAKYEINIAGAVRMLRNVTVHHTIILSIKRYIPADAHDDYLVALALQTSSGFITSGDNDILSEKGNLEKKYKKLKIITKVEFEEMFFQ